MTGQKYIVTCWRIQNASYSNNNHSTTKGLGKVSQEAFGGMVAVSRINKQEPGVHIVNLPQF